MKLIELRIHASVPPSRSRHHAYSVPVFVAIRRIYVYFESQHEDIFMVAVGGMFTWNNSSSSQAAIDEAFVAYNRWRGL